MFIFDRHTHTQPHTHTQCEWGRSRERGRHRIWRRLQAPNCQQSSIWGLNSWHYVLSRSRTLNWLSHPDTPAVRFQMQVYLIHPLSGYSARQNHILLYLKKEHKSHLIRFHGITQRSRKTTTKHLDMTFHQGVWEYCCHCCHLVIASRWRRWHTETALQREEYHVLDFVHFQRIKGNRKYQKL